MKGIHLLVVVLSLLVAAGAWVAFAEHPTARHLRKAVLDTLPEL